MAELTEAQLYNLSCSDNGSRAESQVLIHRLLVQHLRRDHGMTIHEICRKMCLKVKEVKKFLGTKNP